jgi:hypothetical protein
MLPLIVYLFMEKQLDIPCQTANMHGLATEQIMHISKQKKQKNPGKQIPTIEVFAAACAAQRINGTYFKEPAYEHRVTAEGYDEVVTVAQPNKDMVKAWLAAGDTSAITEQDRDDAAAVRAYWKLKLFKVLQGSASGYEQTAVEAASADTIDSHDHLKLGIISSLPAAYLRGVVRDERDEIKQEAVQASRHFGRVGDTVQGQVKILDSVHSQNWGCHFISGVIDGNAVRFTAKEAVEVSKVFKLRGRIKAHRDDNVTQLNYVKLS